MRYFRVIVLTFLLCSISVFSQDNTTKHSIVKGETISSIAQKYNVSIEAIYKLNPNAKKTLHLNQVLLIPNSESKKENISESLVSEQTIEVNHEVSPKETLYGITKQFKTTTELLYKANPKLESEGLKIGQTIIIPSGLTKKEIATLSNAKPQETVEAPKQVTHEVKAKESLYAIAKLYGVTLKELQNANPNIGKKGLSVGQLITIPSNGKLIVSEAVAGSENSNSNANTVTAAETKSVVNEEVLKKKETPVAENKSVVPVVTENSTKEIKADSENQTSEITHLVLPKETKYGIAKKYGITVAFLEKLNPSIQNKLEVGTKLIIQVPGTSNTSTENPVKKEEVVVAEAEKKQDSITTQFPIASQDLIDRLIREASDKIGTRYRSGGITTAGFDCSGLMYSTFGAFDIKLPRSSIEQSSIGEKIDNENAQKGDLIFFRTNGRSRINHVGMVIEVGEDEIKFIHSSTHSGVIISSTKEAYYHRNFAQVNRVLK
ncbi:LysM peptidoglycan-binding domain-containing protein [Flavobacterium sp. WC2509]|uniref:LysM peptidoglycan-binding domain-containing protein n=1 Tax=Flavobacterium sp. WC2509 TaxID=3461406 RepID=UPI004043B440